MEGHAVGQTPFRVGMTNVLSRRHCALLANQALTHVLGTGRAVECTQVNKGLTAYAMQLVKRQCSAMTHMSMTAFTSAIPVGLHYVTLALVDGAQVVVKLTTLPAMSCKTFISVLFASVRMATPYVSVSLLFCHLIIDAIGATPYCSYHMEPG